MTRKQMPRQLLRQLHVKKLFWHVREARKKVRSQYVKKQRQYCRHVYKKEAKFLKCTVCKTYKAEPGLLSFTQRLLHTKTENVSVEVIPKRLWLRYDNNHGEWRFTVQVETFARYNTQALHCAAYEAKKWKEIDRLLLAADDDEDAQSLFKRLNTLVAGNWFASWEPWTCRPHHAKKAPTKRR